MDFYDVLFDVMNKRHRLEDKFPVGCMVHINTSLNEFIRYLISRDYGVYEASGVAHVVFSSPCEVIGIDDLDDDGVMRSFATIMDKEGCIYIVPVSMIEREM